MQGQEDFAIRAAHKWSETLPELRTTDQELATLIRLSRIALVQDRIDAQTLREFETDGIKGTDDFRVVALLRRSENGLTNSEILQQLGGSKAGISTRLDRLHRSGVTTRVPSESDRRSHTNVLTTHGRTVADRVVAAVVAARKQLLEDLPSEHIAALTNALGEILANLDPAEELAS